MNLKIKINIVKINKYLYIFIIKINKNFKFLNF